MYLIQFSLVSKYAVAITGYNPLSHKQDLTRYLETKKILKTYYS